MFVVYFYVLGVLVEVWDDIVCVYDEVEWCGVYVVVELCIFGVGFVYVVELVCVGHCYGFVGIG